LRPVNVCCAIVASHFVARQGRTFRSAIGIAPGLNLDTPQTQKPNVRILILNWTLESQNAKRRAGRLSAPARRTHFFYGPKKPEIACLPTAYAETLAFPPSNRAFVLPPRYGMTIVEIRELVPTNPHTFLCTTRRVAPTWPVFGYPPSGLPNPDFDPPTFCSPCVRFVRYDPGSRSAAPRWTGISLKRAALT
jgi:hypothetical protein